MARVAREAGFGRAPVTVIAPHGVARLLLLSRPPGSTPRSSRATACPSFPIPAAEAVVDVVPVRGGRAVAAAIRRSVVEDFEAVVSAAGLRQERLDLGRAGRARARCSRTGRGTGWWWT